MGTGTGGGTANIINGIGITSSGTTVKTFAVDPTLYLGWQGGSGAPTGVGGVGNMYIRTDNNSLYLGTATGWELVTATASVTPGTIGQFYCTNGSGAAAWCGITFSSDLTYAFAGSTLTIGINTANIPTKSGNNTWTGKSVATPTTATIATGTTLTPTSEAVEITTAADITWTAVPSITSGSPGEKLTLMNVGSYVLILQDKGVLTGTNLLLAGRANYTLSAGNAIDFIYSATAGGWMQRGGGATAASTTGDTWGTITGTWGTVTGTWAAWPL